MKIEIKHRVTGSVIISGEYESVKDCLEKNRGSNLRGSNLRGSSLSYSNLSGSNLSGSNLRDSDLSYSDLRGSDLSYSNLRYSDLSYSNLRGSDLSYSNLSGSNLRGSNLSGSNLRDSDLSYSDLRGAKGYVNSHAVFTEIVRKQEVKLFVSGEWAAIAQISIHLICWATIKKRFPKAGTIFKKLADAGFDEWLKYWETLK